MCELQDWHRQVEKCCVPLPNQLKPQRYWGWSEIDRIAVIHGKMKLSVELPWHNLQAMHCTGLNNCS